MGEKELLKWRSKLCIFTIGDKLLGTILSCMVQRILLRKQLKMIWKTMNSFCYNDKTKILLLHYFSIMFTYSEFTAFSGVCRSLRAFTHSKGLSSAAVCATRHNGPFRWRIQQHMQLLIASIVATAVIPVVMEEVKTNARKEVIIENAQGFWICPWEHAEW